MVYAAPKTVPGFTGTDVRTPLERRFGVPVFVENDVNCAAVGEAHAGAGKWEPQFLCVNYGTGVGGAIVMDGHIYHGASWSAGEIGHILTHAGKDTELCSCGCHGCYEAYSSTTALCRMEGKVLGRPVNGRELFEELDRGGPSPLDAVLDEWCEEVCYGLVSLTHIFNFPLIVLGGGIMNEERVIQAVREKLSPMLISSYRGVRITGAHLGNDAGMLGAWYLAKEKLRKRRLH